MTWRHSLAVVLGVRDEDVGSWRSAVHSVVQLFIRRHTWIVHITVHVWCLLIHSRVLVLASLHCKGHRLSLRGEYLYATCGFGKNSAGKTPYSLAGFLYIDDRYIIACFLGNFPFLKITKPTPCSKVWMCRKHITGACAKMWSWWPCWQRVKLLSLLPRLCQRIWILHLYSLGYVVWQPVLKSSLAINSNAARGRGHNDTLH
jgi:hypothetical protein